MTRRDGIRYGTLLVVGVLIGVFLLTPAGAHVGRRVGHLFNEHIKPRVGYEVVTASITVPANESEFLSASCPAGKRPSGGGVSSLQSNGGHSTFQRVIGSFPDGSGWTALVRNDAPDARTASVYAICVNL